MNLNILPFQVYGHGMFPLLPYATELYLPFLKMPLLAYQESETTEQRIAWLFRAIADINNILACHEEQLKHLKKQVEDIKNEIVTIYEKIEIERRERIEEDLRLERLIDKEREERIAADNALGKRIDDETAARIAADNALGKRIDDETAAREACCEEVKTAINKEITDRKNADKAINQKIDNLPSADFFIGVDMFYPNAYQGGIETQNYPLTINSSRVYGELVTAVSIPPLRVAKSFYENDYPRVEKAYRIKYSKPISYVIDTGQLPQQSYIWASKITSFTNVLGGYFHTGKGYEILYIDPNDSYPRFSDVATWDVILKHDESYISVRETPEYVEINFPIMNATLTMTGASGGGSAKGFYPDFGGEESLITVEALFIDNN